MSSVRKYGYFESFLRLLRYKLIIPMKRAKNPPEYIARGVMIGVLWAMTPTIGIQMVLVLFTWMIMTRYFNWHFSLINGLAWTWVTNVVTMVPVYYIFLITGQLLLGRYDDLSNFKDFEDLWLVAVNPEMGFFEMLGNWFAVLFEGWGVPMLIGSLPWCLITSVLAYHLSYRFVVNYRKEKGINIKANLAHS